MASRRKGLERFAGRLLDQANAMSGVEAGAPTGITVRFALGAVYAVSDWYRLMVPGGRARSLKDMPS
ncbi:hypothetical protein GCM10017691_37500 [Pseudonocardia petroleophila]